MFVSTMCVLYVCVYSMWVSMYVVPLPANSGCSMRMYYSWSRGGNQFEYYLLGENDFEMKLCVCSTYCVEV